MEVGERNVIKGQQPALVLFVNTIWPSPLSALLPLPPPNKRIERKRHYSNRRSASVCGFHTRVTKFARLGAAAPWALIAGCSPEELRIKASAKKGILHVTMYIFSPFSHFFQYLYMYIGNKESMATKHEISWSLAMYSRAIPPNFSDFSFPHVSLHMGKLSDVIYQSSAIRYQL